MAAQAWTLYDSAKNHIGNGTINLDTAIWRIGLYTGGSNAQDKTLSVKASLTNEVAASWGYANKTLSATTWIQGDSAGERRFDCTAVFWSANGGTITSIQYAVVYQSGASNELLCFSSLSSGIFSVTDTNRLTITPSANGIFEMA